MGTEIIIRGKHFPSVSSACKAFGVSRGAVAVRMSKLGVPAEESIEYYIQHRSAGVTRKRWTEAEDRILQDRYTTDGVDIPELKINHNDRAIAERARKFGLAIRENAWTDAEINILRREYPTSGSNIPQLLRKRTRTAISEKARELGVTARVHWSEEEVEILRKKYKAHGTNIPELIDKHGRSAIGIKAGSLGLTKKSIRASEHVDRWTYSEISELHDAVKHGRQPNLPGRTKLAIDAKMRQLGLLKSNQVRVIARKPDIKCATAVWNGLIAVRCKQCGAEYILPEAEARNFGHDRCSTLTPIPKGWRLPAEFVRSSKR